jgi:hypothetical protein
MDSNLNKKYFVGKNDLKYKKSRKIDPSRAIWENDDVRKKFYEIDHDTISYRIDEWKNEGYKHLDLSNLELNVIDFDKICINKDLEFLYSKTENLFMSANKLSGILDFSKFKNLKVIDIRSNNLKILVLPDGLEEIDCGENEIEVINFVKSLKIIDCIKNNIKSIPALPYLQQLSVTENKIDDIYYDYPSLTHFDCSKTNIKNLPSLPKVKYLDISDTNIDLIDSEKCKNINTLVANNTKLEKIPILDNLEVLEIMDTPVKTLEYMPKIHTVYCDYKHMNVSNIYKDKIKVDVYKGKYFTFTINNTK